MTKCCKNCKRLLPVEKLDYTDNGVPKTKYDGYMCLAFACKGLAIHMVDVDKERETCEMYESK